MDERKKLDQSLRPEWLAITHRSLAYEGKTPIRGFSFLNVALGLLSLAYLIYTLIRYHTLSLELPEMNDLVVMVFLGVAMNALICGAASGLFPRFGAKDIWLVPPMAIMHFVFRYTRSKHPSAVFSTDLKLDPTFEPVH